MQYFHLGPEEAETEAEQVVLFKLLSAFGPLPDALMQHIHDQEAGVLLTSLEELVRESGSRNHFAEWPEDEFPNLNNGAKSLVAPMINLDPAKRSSMSDIIKNSYWDGVKSPPSTYGI